MLDNNEELGVISKSKALMMIYYYDMIGKKLNGIFYVGGYFQ